MHGNQCHPTREVYTFPATELGGNSLPSWLSQPGTVLLRRHVRYTKDLSLRDLAPAGDAPKPKTTHTPSDTEILPGNHNTGIAPDPLPLDDDTVSVESPSDRSDTSTSEALTEQNDPDGRSASQKRHHPETDPDAPYSDSERPTPQRRKYFATKYFSSKTNRRAHEETSPSLDKPMLDNKVPRRSRRTCREPEHLRDFLPYE